MNKNEELSEAISPKEMRSIIWGNPSSTEVVPLLKLGGNEVINVAYILYLDGYGF